MSETTLDDIPSTNNGLTVDTDARVRASNIGNEDDETWLYENNKSRDQLTTHQTIPAPSTDTRETETIIPATRSLVGDLFDDESDDDDEIQVTIGNYEPDALTFQTTRPKGRTMPTASVMPSKSTAVRGVDFDAQGVINGQPTYEHDINSAYKDEEKPWKKPGADVTDYFNYGFTEEVWTQYCDRQRRLRSENSLARLNGTHIPAMPPMLPGYPYMGHPHQYIMMNKPMNMPMILRPMNARRPDGRIDVIGTTDQTSRRPMFETPPNFEHASFVNGSSFPGNQPSNGQTIGDLVSTPPSSSSPSSSHGTPVAGTHHNSPVGGHHLPMMTLSNGMSFRPRFVHPHGSGGSQYFSRGPAPGMHGDRPPQPYFIPRHPQQPWGDKNGIPLVHGFLPGSFPSQTNTSSNDADGRSPPEDRSSTPEERSKPEEQRSSVSGDNGKSSKDDRYKDRYRDDHDRHTSSRRRASSKDRSSSSHRPRHRSGDYEYERPQNDRRSSRDRDDANDRYSRKRSHPDDSTRRHHQRSSHRTPPKTDSPSLPTPSESLQTSNESAVTVVAQSNQPTRSSISPVNRSRRDDSERSSSRHKKSSKRSRRDSDNDCERSSNHHRRRSKERSNSSNKKTD